MQRVMPPPFISKLFPRMRTAETFDIYSTLDNAMSEFTETVMLLDSRAFWSREAVVINTVVGACVGKGEGPRLGDVVLDGEVDTDGAGVGLKALISSIAISPVKSDPVYATNLILEVMMVPI